MATEYIGLKQFDPSEIIFNDEELKKILLFFFPGYESTLASFTMTHSMREFAQGLLIEAIDASYGIGFVQIIFDSIFYKPGKSATDFLKTFAKKATKSWFKHLKGTEFGNIKIYEIVRSHISDSFTKPFIMRTNGTVSLNKTTPAVAFLNYADAIAKNKNNNIVWS